MNGVLEVKKQTFANYDPCQSYPLVLPKVRGKVSSKALPFDVEVVVRSLLVIVSVMRVLGRPEDT